MADRPNSVFDLALDRYLDQVLQGDLDGASPQEVDAGVAAIVRRLAALNTAPKAEARFADDLLDHLIGASDAPNQNESEAPMPRSVVLGKAGLFALSSKPSALPQPRWGRTRIGSRPALPAIRPWWRGISGPVVTAALVVLVLTAGLFAGGPLRPNREATAPAGIFAVLMAPATPGPEEVAREVLVETTVPAEALPTGENRLLEIWQETIHPGVTATFPAERLVCCPGPLVDHVLVGELTVRVEGPLRVARAGTATTPGPVEEVAPGTDVVLRAGDTALYDQALPVEYANHGIEPVQLIGGGLFIGRGVLRPSGLIVNNVNYLRPLPPLPAGPVTFVLERMTLPPSATLPGPPTGVLRIVTSGPKVAYLPKAADGSVTNLVREPIEAYALTLLPGGSQAGTPEATSN
jgi:hypothetical protein